MRSLIQCAAAVMVMSAMPMPAQTEAVIHIGMHDQPPLSVPDGSGVFDQVVKELFRRINVRADLVYLPYERSLAMVNAGGLDAESARLPGLENSYANLVPVPESIFRQDFVAFAIKPGITLSGWNSLEPYSVGYLIGWKVYETHVKASRISAVPSARSLFTMLQSGRIDVALFERHSGQRIAEELSIVGVYVVEPPLVSNDLVLYLNRRHADLVPALVTALRAMKADGTYAAILSRMPKRP